MAIEKAGIKVDEYDKTFNDRSSTISKTKLYEKLKEGNENDKKSDDDEDKVASINNSMIAPHSATLDPVPKTSAG